MSKPTRARLAALIAGLSIAFHPGTAIAADQGNQEPAGINLGLTSFYDGFSRPEPGLALQTYAVFQWGNRINDDHGNSLAVVTDAKIDDFVWINQLVYIAPAELFGGVAHTGFTFLWPTVIAFDTSFGGSPAMSQIQFQDNGVGVGDLTLGTFLQFKPVMAGGRPIFSNRVAFDIIAPIGSYDPHKDFNQGAGFVSLTPYWAATVLPIKGLEITARFYYLYNFVNNRPATAQPMWQPTPGVDTTQAGQAFWINYAASYEIPKGLHFGVNGYYFKQFTDDRYVYADGSRDNGAQLGVTGRLQMLALGPGILWDIAKNDKLFANLYFSLVVDNGVPQDTANLRYVHDF